MRVLRLFLFISKGVLLLTAMTTILWLTAVVILGCVLFQRLSGKVGVPALLMASSRKGCSQRSARSASMTMPPTIPADMPTTT